MRRPGPLAFVLTTLLVAGGCTHPVTDGVFTRDLIQVSLRSDKRWLSSKVEKQFDHPVTIAPVRLAHILSRIDLRRPASDGSGREAAVPTELLYDVAEGVSKALARATSAEEVIVMARRRERSLVLFDKQLLTSFVTYVRDQTLFIHMSRSEWPIPERRETDPPQPRIGDHPMKFRLLGGTAMTLVQPQVLAVEWRDPIFSRPTRTKILPTGEIKRKTILFESEPEVSAPADPGIDALPSDLSAEKLRALADLEEARQRGEITESRYRVRRRAILQAD